MTTFLPVTRLAPSVQDALLLLVRELEEGNPVAGRALDIATAVLKGTRPVGTPREVGVLLGVDPKTVTRWERKGWLTPAFRTLGNQRRYYLDDVMTLRNGGQPREPARDS